MRAVKADEFGTSDVFEVVEMEAPSPGPGEVLIDVEAIGVNFSDIMQRRGDYYGGPEPPYTPGTEVAGVVRDVGEGVDTEVGARVAALVSMQDGAYRESVVANEGVVFDVPEHLSMEEAAGFPVQFTTAHNALFEWGGLEEGERVLVHAAAGGVGTAAVQLAAAAGAEVFGTASTSEKLEYAAELGVDHPINYTESDFGAEIEDVTDGAGVELVLDGVGGDTLTESLRILAPFGRLVTYGVASGESATVDPRDVFFENRQVFGYHMGHALEHEPRRVFSAVSALSEKLRSGELSVTVDRTFPLEEVAEAHEYIENRRNKGKVVLVP